MAEWYERINLPLSVRGKLTSPIRDAINTPLNLRTWHSIPIRNKIWSVYAGEIRKKVHEFETYIEEGPSSGDFNAIRGWIDELLEVRGRIFSVTLALTPFELFDDEGAREMLGFLDLRLFDVVRRIEAKEPMQKSTPTGLSAEWLTIAETAPEEPIARAFSLESEDLYDERGEFNAGRVFAAYYLRQGELLDTVLPHLGSLGLPQISDLLVAVSVVGWILGCEDPIAAYSSMDALLGSLSRAHGSEVGKMALQYIERKEPELRQARSRINRAMKSVSDVRDEEFSHLALADLYKRLIEGPFRKYGWIFHCLDSRSWSEPPMLTQLRETLVARKGWVGTLAGSVVIRDIRNGEAHETLIWDGVKSRFLADGVEVEASVVAYAVVLADAFARGCDAAIACYRTLEAEHEPARPREHDLGRLASWRRAEALFGTNGIRVVRSHFNSKVARITCFELKEERINPCLQALVACHGLLPYVERFEVFTLDDLGDNEPVVAVSREALERTVPIWEMALNSFTSMPFSTFLPANLDSRCQLENVSLAARSVAWIAVDDFLDALDGGSEQWGSNELELFSKRVALVALAAGQCLIALPREVQVRLRAVEEDSVRMIKWLSGLSAPIRWEILNRAEPISRFRHWWGEWGPVDRLPTVFPMSNESRLNDHRPMLREKTGDLRWRTI